MEFILLNLINYTFLTVVSTTTSYFGMIKNG